MPNETPEFDFGRDVTYNSNMVADRVMWPLADSLWGGDWRQESQEAFEFVFPKHYKCDGKIFDVTLETDCYVLTEQNGNESLSHNVTMRVEEFGTEFNTPIMLEAAKVAIEHYSDPGADEYDEEAEFEWPEGDESTFIVKSGAQYSFDTDGTWRMGLYRRVEGYFNWLDVPLLEAELSGLGRDRLRLPDLERIALGCVALRAPEKVMKAFPIIESRAVVTH